MGYKKFLASSLAYASILALIPTGISVDAAGKVLDLTKQKGEKGYVQARYYSGGTANMSHNNFEEQNVFNFKNGEIKNTGYVLQGDISTEEYIERNERSWDQAYIVNKNTQKRIDKEKNDQALIATIAKKHGVNINAEGTSINLDNLGSNTNEIWYSYGIWEYKDGVSFYTTGYISENKEFRSYPKQEKRRNLNPQTEKKNFEKERRKKFATQRKYYPYLDTYHVSGYIIDSTEDYWTKVVLDKNLKIVAKFEKDETIINVRGNEVITLSPCTKYIRYYTLANGKLAKKSEVKISTTSDFRIDIQVDEAGKVWLNRDGKIAIVENGKIEELYKINEDYFISDVYDKENIIFTNVHDLETIVISEGELVTPYRWEKKNNKYYLYNMSNEKQTGWKEVDGKHYYMDKNGVMQTNKWVGSYYVGSNGVMATNKWVGSYYCGSNGKYVKNKWVKTNNKWYYASSNGKYLKNTSQKIANKTYKFNSSGVCLNP